MCAFCREQLVLTDIEIDELGVTKEMAEKYPVYKSRGCDKCSNTGYKGRTVISELLVISDNIRSLILANADSNTIKKEAIKEGMVTIRQNAVAKVLQGVTTVDELFRATQSE